MKKFIDIIADIAAAKARITDTAKTEKELDRQTMREVWKNGTEEEKTAAYEKYKATEARYIAELKENERVKVLCEVLRDNAAQAYFSENIGTICDIWNRYKGKPHGEKTADKIRSEIYNAIGSRCWIHNKYDDVEITVYFDYGSRYPFRELVFHPIWNGEKQPALVNNKVQPIAAENMKVYCCGEYVEDPETHTAAIFAAHTAAQEAEKAFSEAVSNYNALCRGNVPHASTREGVKNWII